MKLILLFLLITLNNLVIKSDVVYLQFDSGCETLDGCSLLSPSIWSGGKVPGYDDSVYVNYTSGYQSLFLNSTDYLTIGSIFVDAPGFLLRLEDTASLEVVGQLSISQSSSLTISGNTTLIASSLNVSDHSSVILNSHGLLSALDSTYIDPTSSIQASDIASMLVGGVLQSSSQTVLAGQSVLVIFNDTTLYNQIVVANLNQQSNLIIAANATLLIAGTYLNSNDSSLAQYQQSALIINDTTSSGILIQQLTADADAYTFFASEQSVTINSINSIGLVDIASPTININQSKPCTNDTVDTWQSSLSQLTLHDAQTIYLKNCQVDTLVIDNNNFTLTLDSHATIGSSLNYNQSTINFIGDNMFAINSSIAAAAIYIGAINGTDNSSTTTLSLVKSCSFMGNVVVTAFGELRVSLGQDVTITESLTIETGGSLVIIDAGSSLYVAGNLSIGQATVTLELSDTDDPPLTASGQSIQVANEASVLSVSFITTDLETSEQYVIMDCDYQMVGTFSSVYIYVKGAQLNHDQYNVFVDSQDNQYVLSFINHTSSPPHHFAAWKMIAIISGFIVFVCIIVGIIYQRIRTREYRKYQLIE